MTITRMISSAVVVALSAVGLSAQVVAGPVSAVIPFDGTLATITNDNVGEDAPTTGLLITNTSVPTGGSDEAWSPSLEFCGNRWTGSASQQNCWQMYAIVQTDFAPNDLLSFQRTVNGGSLTEHMWLSTSGLEARAYLGVFGGSAKFELSANSSATAWLKATSTDTGLILMGNGTEGVGIGANMDAAASLATGVTAVVKDNTTTTGDTLFAVDAGDGEAGNLQEWRADDKSVLASVDAVGKMSAAGLDITAAGNITYFDSVNVASTATMTLPEGNLVHITGTDAITTMNTCNAANNGRLAHLIFDDVLTFTDGNNLKLAGDFVTTADDTIGLVCDGANWYEMSRSIN